MRKSDRLIKNNREPKNVVLNFSLECGVSFREDYRTEESFEGQVSSQES